MCPTVFQTVLRETNPAGEAQPASKALTGHGDARALGLRADGCRVKWYLRPAWDWRFVMASYRE